MHEMCVAAMAGQVQTAVAIHMKLLALHKQLFCEPSPAPTKWALAQMGRCLNNLRLPVLPLTSSGQTVVAGAMREAGLL
jgi:4-hydroxy-tetrahydrodipicolinate synthase